jgi:hypothetical protein
LAALRLIAEAMKPVILISVAVLLSSNWANAAEGPKRRPVERERRIEFERQEKERRERERQREQAEPNRERTEIPVIRLNRVEVLRDFIASAPEHSAMKGWSSEIFDFVRHFEGRSPSEREVKAWMKANVRGGGVRESSFRGALREVSDVVRLQAEGYREVIWNKQKERVIAELERGRKVDLGERIIDIIATRPDGKRVYLETKNADLTRTFRQPELELLAKRASVETLVRYCEPANEAKVNVSREFKEMVKDIWLAKSQGRAIEWKANAAPDGLGYALRNYGIELHVYH